MPFALRDRAQIHWNEQGQGEPIIMIMGLGCDASLWYRLSERLAKHFRVITLDNRGSGKPRSISTSCTVFRRWRVM